MKINTSAFAGNMLMALCVFASCKKETINNNFEDGKSTVVKDLAGDTLASMGDPAPGSNKEKRSFYPFVFRFSDQKQVFLKNAADSAQWLKTTDWDICFSDPYNSLVSVNSGTKVASPGYGGPGQGVSIVIIEKPYAQVTEAPADDVFTSSGRAGVGWDPGNGNGWFFYSLTNHIMVPVKNRTFVLRTAAGKFAKLELINAYLGNPSTVTDLFWPAPYLTFRYYVQEDGSRNLNTQ